MGVGWVGPWPCPITFSSSGTHLRRRCPWVSWRGRRRRAPPAPCPPRHSRRPRGPTCLACWWGGWRGVGGWVGCEAWNNCGSHNTTRVAGGDEPSTHTKDNDNPYGHDGTGLLAIRLCFRRGRVVQGALVMASRRPWLCVVVGRPLSSHGCDTCPPPPLFLHASEAGAGALTSPAQKRPCLAASMTRWGWRCALPMVQTLHAPDPLIHPHPQGDLPSSLQYKPLVVCTCTAARQGTKEQRPPPLCKNERSQGGAEAALSAGPRQATTEYVYTMSCPHAPSPHARPHSLPFPFPPTLRSGVHPLPPGQQAPGAAAAPQVHRQGNKGPH